MGTSDRAARLQMTLLRTEATGKSMASPFFALELPRWCFSGGSDGKEHTCNTGDPGSSPGLGRSPGEGTGYPLQYSGLENSTDCIVHGIIKSQTQLSDFHTIAMAYTTPS